MAWPMIAAMGLSALGSVLGARSQNKAAKAQGQRQSQIDAELMNFMSQLGGGGQRPDPRGVFGQAPQSFDQMGLQMYQGQMANNNAGANQNFLDQFKLPAMPDVPNAYRDLGLATDPILQAMRSGSNDAGISSNLMGLLNTGNPYDTSLISSALDPIRQRGLSREVAALHAAAPGLGSRFGSATRRGEVDLRRQSLEDSGALDAQMLFAGHEAAQGRRLQAAGALTARDQLQLGRDTGALQALLGKAGIGIQQGGLNLQQGQFGLDSSRLGLDAFLGTGQLGLAQNSQQAQLLQMLMGNQNAQNQQRLQALGIMGGQQVAAGPGYGPAVGDMGQLLLMYQMLNQKK